MNTLQKLITEIHATPTKAVVVATGGGSGVFPLLLDQGGGSNTLIAGLLPWNEKETVALLGFTPEKFASEKTARHLAVAAYNRAVGVPLVSDPAHDFIGVACSSSLQRTPDERDGRRHVIYAALHTASKTIAVTVDLFSDPMPTITIGTETKPLKADAYMVRRVEEEVNSRLLFHLIAVGCGCATGPWHPKQEELFPLLPDWLHCRILWTESALLGHDRMSALARNQTGSIAFRCQADARGVAIAPLAGGWSNAPLLFPGAFNPLHVGHVEMVDVASAFHKMPCSLELSLANFSKPDLDWIEVERRLQQIATLWLDRGHSEPIDVYITRAALFTDKVLVFPGATFVMGVDTAQRIVDDKASVESLKARLQGLHNRFFVFGRDCGGKYLGGDDLFLPAWFQNSTTWSEHRLEYAHVSSTELRKVVAK